MKPVMVLGPRDWACTEQRPRRRMTWAELMRRVFSLDVLECPVCRGPMKIIAEITQPEVIERFLAALDLPTKHPEIERSRPPPQLELPLAGHGVLNGGHTYLAILEAIRRAESGDKRFAGVGQRAQVIITVGIGIPEEEIWQISRARNTSQKVPLYALRELAGDWSLLKDKVPAATRPLVAYKPNDPEAPDAEYDMTDLVRRIALLNNELFPAQDDQHPKAAYTSLGSW